MMGRCRRARGDFRGLGQFLRSAGGSVVRMVGSSRLRFFRRGTRGGHPKHFLADHTKRHGSARVSAGLCRGLALGHVADVSKDRSGLGAGRHVSSELAGAVSCSLARPKFRDFTAAIFGDENMSA